MNKKKNLSILLFSDDLDKCLATFFIASTAATLNQEVTIFFTFWGINLLRDSQKKNVKKGLVDTMFGMMMPKGPSQTKLSKMHMAGMGTMMMKNIMKKKNYKTLEEYMKLSKDAGVKFIACESSMEIMGIKKEELIDEIEFGNAATFVQIAIDSEAQLVI